ncbi:Hypothetical predicted protein, partial [Paramuricea clavata]
INQGVQAVIGTTAPGQEDDVWCDFMKGQVEKCTREIANARNHYLEAIIASYGASESKTSNDRALESNNGVKGVVPYVVEGVSVSSTKVPKITEISLLRNFKYDSNGLRVWKAFDIGNGKLLKWNEFDKNSQCFPQELSVVTTKTHRGRKAYSTFQPKNEPVEDIVKQKWTGLFTRTIAEDHASIGVQLSAVQLIEGKNVPRGWALKKSEKSKKFSIKVKQYLIEKFQLGETTGNKVNPLQVSVDMRCARNEDGKRMFSASE